LPGGQYPKIYPQIQEAVSVNSFFWSSIWLVIMWNDQNIHT
jgi:hypothetical protein